MSELLHIRHQATPTYKIATPLIVRFKVSNLYRPDALRQYQRHAGKNRVILPFPDRIFYSASPNRCAMVRIFDEARQSTETGQCANGLPHTGKPL